MAKLDYDGYRDIRFRKDQALLGAPFKMEMFHPGFLFTRPVRISIVKNGAVEQVPYAAGMFDYGKNRFDPPLPRELGFAGFRIHYPLNHPSVDDELIVFLGSSYFRFLGRGQHYGLSARGIAIGSGESNEEFPEFREFWIEQPDEPVETDHDLGTVGRPVAGRRLPIRRLSRRIHDRGHHGNPLPASRDQAPRNCAAHVDVFH